MGIGKNKKVLSNRGKKGVWWHGKVEENLLSHSVFILDLDGISYCPIYRGDLAICRNFPTGNEILQV